MRGSTILLSYAKGSRGLLITPAHPTYEGFYYTVIICRGEQRTINHPSPPPPIMRGSTILLSYAKGSRGLLITLSTPPPYEGFYYTVIICRGEQRTINHPSPPSPPHYEGFYSPVIICQGEQRTINHPCPPPPPYEGFYYTVIICQGEQRTINHPSPPPPPPYEGFYYPVIICQGEQRTINHPSPPPTPLMRGSTILLSYAKGSRELLITPAHPTYEGFYYTVIICKKGAEDY